MNQPLPSPAFEAALVIPVPEAEPLVRPYRFKFDPSAAVGVPAHITVNYPFKPHLSRPSEARKDPSRLLAAFPQFTFSLLEVRTFPGVIYLAPDPPLPFIALIEAVAHAFPDSPPYEGHFEQPVPHLTVAQVEENALPPIRSEFSRQAKVSLPIRARATEIWLMDNRETQWKTRAIFPLKPSAAIPSA